MYGPNSTLHGLTLTQSPGGKERAGGGGEERGGREKGGEERVGSATSLCGRGVGKQSDGTTVVWVEEEWRLVVEESIS
jgi:hypothetical protein